jgi:hypothetical protein
MWTKINLFSFRFTLFLLQLHMSTLKPQNAIQHFLRKKTFSGVLLGSGRHEFVVPLNSKRNGSFVFTGNLRGWDPSTLTNQLFSFGHFARVLYWVLIFYKFACKKMSKRWLIGKKLNDFSVRWCPGAHPTTSEFTTTTPVEVCRRIQFCFQNALGYSWPCV